MTQSRPVSANRRKYGLSVFIGRFSPVHKGHLEVIRQALTVAESTLIVIGSANAARTSYYVPFTAPEREQMIRLALTAEENIRTHFAYVEDQGNMQKWTSLVRSAANAIEPDNKRITLIGHAKDHTSFYLKGFRGWASENVDNYLGLSATAFREKFFSPNFTNLTGNWAEGLDDSTVEWLLDFHNNGPAYQYLVDERIDVEATRAKYGPGPFITGDSVIIQGDHVLVIERGNYPFKGCIAFPGGFVEPDERIYDAIIREASEETGIKVPDAIMRKALLDIQYWDAPFRDPRARVISWSGLFHLNPVPPASMTDPKEIAKFLELPRVSGQDDAAKAYWIPIADLRREDMAFDHFMVLQHCLDKLPKDN